MRKVNRSRLHPVAERHTALMTLLYGAMTLLLLLLSMRAAAAPF